MIVHRSKGVTTLKLTKRERDTLKAAHELTGYVQKLPELDPAIGKAAASATAGLEQLCLVLTEEKETVEA